MLRILLTALLVAAPGAALAEGTRVDLGVLATPQYQGAKDYQFRAVPGFAFDVGQVEVRSSRFGVEADLIPSRGFAAGPILRYNTGRDPSNIDNAAVSLLPKIDGAVELGAFGSLAFPIADATFLSPRVEVTKGLEGGHEGLVATGSLGVFRLAGPWRLGANANVTYADDTYMGAFFGVPTGSASGLAAYTPSGGVKDVGVSAFASYSFNDNWGVTAVAGLSQLVGDAADSPIVTQTGSPTQGFLTIAVSYTFN